MAKINGKETKRLIVTLPHWVNCQRGLRGFSRGASRLTKTDPSKELGKWANENILKPFSSLFPQRERIFNFRVVWEPFPALCTSEWVACTTICRRLVEKNKDKTFEHLWKHIWFLLQQKNCSTLVKLMKKATTKNGCMLISLSLPTKFKIFHKFTWAVDGCLSAEV